MRNAFLTFEHVEKKFPGRVALSDISFDLPSGKVIGIIGPNGAGKSTMLKLMAGLLRPNKGKVLLEGKAIERRSSEDIAYLPDQGGCYTFYTVAETLQFYKSIYADFDHQKALEMIDFMQLELHRNVGSLSKGNLTRLKMVTTLSRRAPLILLDEPLSGLDPMIRESIIKGLIAFINFPEQTVIMATHEVAEVEPILDMVIAIKDGGIVHIDDVENIRLNYESSLVDWMKELFQTNKNPLK
ncbi:MAG TPA: ABC transporter ATP-binding protein [Bacilli bacterium]